MRVDSLHLSYDRPWIATAFAAKHQRQITISVNCAIIIYYSNTSSVRLKD